MKPTLYAHPFSSYCQKALIALYENHVAFDFALIEPQNEAVTAEFARLWPIGKFPILVDGERTVLEASIVIEYLQAHYPGPVQLIPDDAELALEVRMLDRIFDNYVMTPMGRAVFDAMRPPEQRDPTGVAAARADLDRIYAWIDDRMAGREWAVGDSFTLADCAAAPSLFYADWVHPISPEWTNLKAYRARLLSRPTFARAVDEARPYRSYFPLGAPDRD